MSQTNSNLHKAKSAKNDEFFTRLEDIENELENYKDFFKGKTVYCNCDHYNNSNFKNYFLWNFKDLGLKSLICTCIVPDGHGVYYSYDGKNEETMELNGNGDFTSKECIELLKLSDVVVTNPPFSLFRDFFNTLMKHDKKFIIIGSQNAITNKDLFPYIQKNELWLGINYIHEFLEPNGQTRKFGNVCWYTNVENNKRNQPLELTKHYSPENYPKYDNFNAIEVSKVSDIPMDYDGIMGVPLTFLYKFCPSQFEIIWQASGNTRASAPKDILHELGYTHHPEDRGGCGVIDNKRIYSRILIKKL